MTVRIETATPAEMGEALDFLAEAFEDDAVMHRIIIGDDERVRRMRDLLAAELRSRAPEATLAHLARIDGRGEIVGTTLWVPPAAGRTAGDRIRGLLAMPQLVRALRLGNLRRARRATEAFDPFFPRYPHWYLAYIAVGAAARGHGVGSLLLEQGLAAVDESGLPAYLEATSAGSRRLYQRYGFIPLGTIDLGSGVEATPMLRPPALPAED